MGRSGLQGFPELLLRIVDLRLVVDRVPVAPVGVAAESEDLIGSREPIADFSVAGGFRFGKAFGDEKR
jgi:hypothetical protein